MCFGGSETKVVESSNKLPKWAEDYSKKTVKIADQVTSRPYQGYTGQRVAGFNPDQQAAFDMVRDASGAYVPYFEQAAGAAGKVAGREVVPFSAADITGYMNPYTSSVVDRSLAEIERQAAIERNQINARMANPSVGAYGGARHGIVEAEQRRNTADLKNNIIAQLYAQAFDNATGQYRADQAAMLQSDANRLGASGQLVNIGTGTQAARYADAAARRDIGGQQQQQAQQGLDIGYQDFLRQWNYPIEMLNVRSAVGSQTPYSTTTMQEQLAGNSAAQNLGAFASLVGAGSMAYGAFA